MSHQPEFTCPTPKELGRMIPGYHVTELVSSGVRGALYHATQISLDRTVTIKVLPPEIGRDAALRHAFEVEAKAMARLNHPNLVDVFDFGDIHGMLYIIMEHVPGRSLFETTHGHHVDPKESARLVADLCLGLHHAHQAGIVHRALNPKNVLINNEAQAKIVDFGIAGLTRADAGDEIPHYSAPEVLQDADTVDARADIYSSGMMLYELVVGNLPSHPYIAPSQARNCRPEFDHIIYRAIQPAPDKRYQSASEMSLAIEDLLEKMGTAPTQQVIKTMLTAASTPPVSRRPASAITVAKPSQTPAIVVTLLTLAIIIGIIAVVIRSGDDNQSAPTEPTATREAIATPPVSTKRPKPKKKRKRPSRGKRITAQTTDKPTAAPEPAASEPASQQVTTATANTPPHGNSLPDAPAHPEPPQFDIEAWLDKARSFMKNKARYAISDYDEALAENIDDFQKDVERTIRKIKQGGVREQLEARAQISFSELKILGQLPEKLPANTPKQLKQLYPEALDNQQAVDDKFFAKFSELRIFYIKGIDRQISILKKQHNHTHAASLEKEIDLTQDDMKRFIRILRGEQPDIETKDDGATARPRRRFRGKNN